MIDTYASHSFVSNERLLDDIRTEHFTINGATGSDTGSKIGTLPGLGPAVLLKNANGANGLCIRDVHKYKFTLRPKEAWTLHIAEGLDLAFEWDERLANYGCVFDRNTREKMRCAAAMVTAHVISVAERERSFPQTVTRKAKAARELSARLWFPSDAMLMRSIVKGAYLNCDITPTDVQNALTIYGQDRAVAAGKTKRSGPSADTRVDVTPSAQKEQWLYIDIMYWRTQPFLLAIAKPLYLLVVRPLSDSDPRSGEYIAPHLEKIRQLIESRAFTVTVIKADPEGCFKTLSQQIKGLDIGTSGSHVPDIEVEIRVIKERLRCMDAFLSVPVPARLIKEQVNAVVKARNMTIRPHQDRPSIETFTGMKIDIKKDVKAKFMDYIIASRNPDESVLNTGAKRTADAVYLYPAGNRTGGTVAYDLNTLSKFTCNSFKTAPMPEIIVEKLLHLWKTDEPKAVGKRKKMLVRIDKNGPHKLSDIDLDEENPNDMNIGRRDNKNIITLPTARAPPIAQSPAEIAEMIDTENDDDDHHIPNTATENDDDDHHIPNLATENDGDDQHIPERVGDSADVGEDVGAPAEFPTDVGEDAREPEPPPARNNRQPTEDEASPYILANTAKLIHGSRKIGQRRTNKVRKNKTSASRGVDAFTLHAYRISLRSALKNNDRPQIEAVIKELQQLEEYPVWKYIDPKTISKTKLKSIMRSHMFLKRKNDAAGAFLKWKARLVAGGNTQDKELFDNISAPTVALESVFMIIAIAAIESRKIYTLDITGAYLNCEIPEDEEPILMVLDPVTARILSEFKPEAKSYIGDSGEIIVQLTRALYGMVQSARLWYLKLKDTLSSIGFKPNAYDLCVFNKTSADGNQITIAFHVDDLIMTSASTKDLEETVSAIGNHFNGISVTRGSNHSYLGMEIQIKEQFYGVSMRGYLDKIIQGDRYRETSYPMGPNLFKTSENQTTEEERIKFHSDVAKALFIAKRIKPMTLLPVSVLASRVQKPSRDDVAHLDKLYGYLKATRDKHLRFKRGGTIAPKAFIDASWAVHDDCTSRTGIVLLLAGCCVGAWTKKQKLVTKHSTESEIVALSDGLTEVIWARNFLETQGYHMTPFPVYQDNQPVIDLMMSDRRTHQRTKHLSARYFHAKQLEETKIIKIIKQDTKWMLADILTKPVQGQTFTNLSDILTGNMEFPNGAIACH